MSFILSCGYIHIGPFLAILMIVDMKFVSTVFCSYKMTYRSVINRKSILGIKFGPKFEYKPEFGIKNKFKYILLRHTHLLLFGELVS